MPEELREETRKLLPCRNGLTDADKRRHTASLMGLIDLYFFMLPPNQGKKILTNKELDGNIIKISLLLGEQKEKYANDCYKAKMNY